MANRGKGGGYERELSKMLSDWWIPGRDDIFWRTAASGGRATNRFRQGKKTYGQSGDIQAVDPVGSPLTRVISIEAKRGHKDAHIGDTLDRLPGKKLRWWEVFLYQAQRESEEAGVPFWMLVIRRDARQALVYIPWGLYAHLQHYGATLHQARPWIKVCPITATGAKKIGFVFATTLKTFLARVKPEHVRQLCVDFCEV